MGYLAEKKIKEFLVNRLPDDYEISSGGVSIPGYDRGSLPFDILIKKDGSNKTLGIEISFQVTTNSVVERKAREAQNNQNLMHENGHRIGYIIDGAGNFNRRNAISTICSHSDCTVAYSEEEFEVLALWAETELN